MMEEFRTCPRCGAPATKALYAGFPMWLCIDLVSCSTVFGCWAWVMLYLPYNGVFIRYDWYLSGLWYFLTHRKDDQ